MGKPGKLTPQRAFELQQFVLVRWAPEIFNRFQCVWLGHALGLTATEAARALGLNVATVRRIRSEFERVGCAAIEGKGNRGGRRNQHLTAEEEERFLSEHVGAVERAGADEVAALKAALEGRLGHAVHKTTIYRMLERHGLREKRRPGAAAQEGVRRKSPLPLRRKKASRTR